MNNNFEEFLYNQLNKQQQKAVTNKNGTILVIAGAGSGKTRVITARITHLILNENVEPHQLIALTFTNKAAKEMRERVSSFLGDTQLLPFVGTFHSYCLQILKRNSHLLAHPTFSIFDADDQHKLLTDILKRSNSNQKITPRNLAYTISYIKNNLTLDEGSSVFDAYDPIVKEMFHVYEEEKRACNAFDFDDLLLEVVRLFKNQPEFKKRFNNTVKHILVDEYQDTNIVQHLLLNQMSKDKDGKQTADSVCVVGDEDQSIYSWRGATVENIQNFEKDFLKTHVIKLEQNYRSAKPILDVANHIISHNKNRHKKNLWSNKKGDNCIRFFTFSSEYQEGDFLSSFLEISKEEHPLSSNAILYRNHFQSRSIEEALIKKSIPYKIIGGIQFYERKEVKDLVAYMRIAVNPFDRVAFFRIINCPPRKLGKKFEEMCLEMWQQEPFLTFEQILQKLLLSNDLKKMYKSSVEKFINLFKSIDRDASPKQIAKEILDKTDYFEYLFEHYEKTEAQQKVENINELLKAIDFFERDGIDNLSAFLDHVALLQKQSTHKDDKKDKVQLMTLHAAKGLEFETVMVVGLEEGILPSTRSMESQEAIEEERRLFYVGITRAKDRLILTNSRYRTTYGQTTDQLPSRFLDELPSKLVENESCVFKTSYEINYTISNWLNIPQPENKFSKIVTFGRPTININQFSKNNAAPSLTGAWKINQPVKHTTFGMGLIKKVEKKSESKTYLTIKFKIGQKKIDAKFITKA
ncbi:UvrD-helicase domain-containing protein [bacterium]|nr:UvrD-helicase domain-containing protein [bacterium]